jgi:hypothetical protein
MFEVKAAILQVLDKTSLEDTLATSSLPLKELVS